MAFSERYVYKGKNYLNTGDTVLLKHLRKT